MKKQQLVTAVEIATPAKVAVHTDESFLNLANPNQIWIVINLLALTPIGIPIDANSIEKW